MSIPAIVGNKYTRNNIVARYKKPDNKITKKITKKISKKILNMNVLPIYFKHFEGSKLNVYNEMEKM